MKKFLIRLILFGLILSVVLSTVIFLSFRQDIAFRIYGQVISCFRKSDCSVVYIPTSQFKTDELVFVTYDQILINSQYQIPNNLSKDLIEIDGFWLSEASYDSFEKLQNAIKIQYNKNLKIRSAYRTSEEQKELYETLPSDLAAPVGASEHELGLALDVYIEGTAGGEILKTEAGRYLHSNCHEYGFIIRYPYGKSDITGITYEPWHIRYIGKPHAEIIYLESLTLEEYLLDFLKPNVYYQMGNYILSRQIATDGMINLPIDYLSLEISVDNCGGYLVTAIIAQTN